MTTIVLNVTTLNDQNDRNLFDGLSLREAILDANDNLSDDYIIRLQGGQTYFLTIENTGSDENFAASGDLDIIGNVSIEVTGNGLATINGNTSTNVLHVLENGSLNLTNIIVTGGQSNYGPGIYINENGSATLSNTVVSDNSATDNGGGIYNNGNLVIQNNTVITDNIATDNGGGIFNASTGTAIIDNTNITNNNSRSAGGGILNNGNMNITNSNINSNNSRGGGISNNHNIDITNSVINGNISTGNGGGLRNSNGIANINNTTFANNTSHYGGAISNKSSLNIIGSTFVENVSEYSGGAINNDSGTSDIVNSTFTKNSAKDNGGAIFHSRNGITNLTNVTITANIANSDNSGYRGGNGGGIASGGGVILKNSIVSGNFDTPNNEGYPDIYPDVSGDITGSGSNIIGNLNGASGTIGTGSDRVGINPRLGNLADNGGPTQTIALLPGSPAIDTGNNSLLPLDTDDLDGDANINEPFLFDQRGLNRTVNDTTDVGAFEVQAGENLFNPLNTPIFRLKSLVRPGTYLFTGESETQSIFSNPTTSSQFIDEGFAFNVGVAAGDDLIPLYRFQNLEKLGTYVYVGEQERDAIQSNPNFSQTFSLEGLAFYVYGAGSGKGTPLSRLQNLSQPGTYLFTGQEETDAIFANPAFANNFNNEGIAFEVFTF